MIKYEIKIERVSSEGNIVRNDEIIEAKSYTIFEGFINFFDEKEIMIASFPKSDIISIKKQ